MEGTAGLIARSRGLCGARYSEASIALFLQREGRLEGMLPCWRVDQYESHCLNYCLWILSAVSFG